MKLRNVAVLGAVLFATACSRDSWQRLPGPDDAVALIPWFANMSTDVAIRPYKMPLMPVEGTVPVTGLEPVFAPQQLAPSNNVALGREYPNTVNRTAEGLVEYQRHRGNGYFVGIARESNRDRASPGRDHVECLTQNVRIADRLDREIDSPLRHLQDR